MKQPLALFEYLTQLSCFRNVTIIVLLNKFDILEQRIINNPISDHFPEYTGSSDCFGACRFFADEFAKIDHRSARSGLLRYPTSAVDPESFKSIAQNIRPINADDEQNMFEVAPAWGLVDPQGFETGNIYVFDVSTLRKLGSKSVFRHTTSTDCETCIHVGQEFGLCPLILLEVIISVATIYRSSPNINSATSIFPTL